MSLWDGTGETMFVPVASVNGLDDGKYEHSRDKLFRMVENKIDSPCVHDRWVEVWKCARLFKSQLSSLHHRPLVCISR
jgi:hypothetical protein